jgi:hypothetical protein
MQVSELSQHMRDEQTQHLRFAVHTTNHQGDMVELFNTGMMEVEEFMCTRPITTTMPAGCDDEVNSKVLLDFNAEVTLCDDVYECLL